MLGVVEPQAVVAHRAVVVVGVVRQSATRGPLREFNGVQGAEQGVVVAVDGQQGNADVLESVPDRERLEGAHQCQGVGGLVAATLHTYSNNLRLDSISQGRTRARDTGDRHAALLRFVGGGVTRLATS